MCAKVMLQRPYIARDLIGIKLIENEPRYKCLTCTDAEYYRKSENLKRHFKSTHSVSVNGLPKCPPKYEYKINWDKGMVTQDVSNRDYNLPTGTISAPSRDSHPGNAEVMKSLQSFLAPEQLKLFRIAFQGPPKENIVHDLLQTNQPTETMTLRNIQEKYTLMIKLIWISLAATLFQLE